MIERAIRTWTHNGIECYVIPSPIGALNGYVQLPKQNKYYSEDDEDNVPYDAPGGITYANGKGLIGFDTLHMGDAWDRRELEGLGIKGTYPLPPYSQEGVTHWTLTHLMNQVEMLADRVACDSGACTSCAPVERKAAK